MTSELLLTNQSILRHVAVDGFRPSVNAAAHVVNIAKALTQYLLCGVLAAHAVMTQERNGRAAVEREQVLLASFIQ